MPITDIIKLKEDERVLAVVRHFPLVYAPRILAALLLFSAPFFLMIPLFRLGQWGGIIFAAATLAGALIALRAFVVWRWNAFILTSQRIVDVDQRGFFDRIVSEAPLSGVQDVSYRVRGFWGTVFGYGTIVVQTAGETTHLELNYVRRPKEIHHLITETLTALRPIPSGERDAKVSSLLEAAANLSGAEARAFLTGLQSAVNRPPPPSRVADEDVKSLLQDEP